MHHLTGKTIGMWQLESLLTVNDRSSFFQARHIETGEIGRVCAGGSLTPQCVERRIAPYLAFEGDGIFTVKSYELEAHNSVFQLPMYDEKETVKDRINEQGSFSLPETLDILARVASALDVGHAAGLVHGSVRPYSILVYGTLMDWGLEYCIDECLEPLVEVTMPNSRLAYCPIEQIRGFEIKPATERFSLAAVAYEMLTGQTVYRSSNLLGFIAEYIKGNETIPAVSISQQSLHLPSLLDVVFERGLARNPDERFDSAMGFVEAMASCI